MDSKILRAWTTGCGRQTALLFGLMAVDLVVISAVVVIALRAPVTPDDRAMIIAIGVLVDVVLSTLVAILWGVSARILRMNPLNDAFASLDLTGRSVFKGGGFTGPFHGRRVDAYLSRGPRFDLYLEAGARTRLTAGTPERLTAIAGQLANKPPLQLNDPAYQDLRVYPQDETWARSYLDDPSVRDAIHALTAAQNQSELRYFVISPGSVALRVHYARLDAITADALLKWLEALLTLARVTESLPPPEQTAEPSRLERYARMDRAALLLPILGIVVAIALATLGCMGAAVLIITRFA
jgi:hypothetical protein